MRTGGLLLHPTSLPGPHGIGDLGEGSREFVDFLADAGLRWWQMLPVVPPGAGNSPYKSPSAFAGSPWLISLHRLVDKGLLDRKDVAPVRGLDAREVRYATVRSFKRSRLRRAHRRFLADAGARDRARVEKFWRTQESWLRDYALFNAACEQEGTARWTTWPRALRARSKRCLAALDRETIRYSAFVQYLFFEQWAELRKYARARDVRLMGDLPIFVAHESADVWFHPELFKLSASGNPRVVAGVPPDGFNRSGQRWGNPLYRWDRLRARRYRWWIARLRRSFELFDCVRMDHFLGFLRAWEIPADARDARRGHWAPGPGAHFFQAVKKALPRKLLIAENLGLVTQEAERLRRRFRFPGMRVLQFDPLGSGATDQVVYTGTHDNDTTLGWWRSLERAERARYARTIRSKGGVAWGAIEAAFRSPARIAIVPVQDVLGLTGAARMNRPGTARGNWTWRLRRGALQPEHARRLRALARRTGRVS